MKTQATPIFLIADDHSVVRQGLSLLIRELLPNATIFHAASFKETFKMLQSEPIEIMVLDINFPDGNSLGIIADIKAIRPEVKILIFSAYDEDIYALRYLNAGASGFLNKGCSETEMKQALQSMIVSGKYVTQNIKDRILDSYMSKTPLNPIEKLSPRELEVARLLVKGYGNLEISGALQIRKTTVSTFKNRIFEKLGVDNLAELIAVFQLHFLDRS